MTIRDGYKNFTYLERNLLILIEEHPHLRLAHPQIAISEVVADVPAEWTELPPLLNDSVEQRGGEHQFLPFVNFAAVVQLLVGVPQIRPDHVRPQPLGRFQSHFDSVL